MQAVMVGVQDADCVYLYCPAKTPKRNAKIEQPMMHAKPSSDKVVSVKLSLDKTVTTTATSISLDICHFPLRRKRVVWCSNGLESMSCKFNFQVAQNVQYHLDMGVDLAVVYDRAAEPFSGNISTGENDISNRGAAQYDKKVLRQVLTPLIETGQVVHVPFPGTHPQATRCMLVFVLPLRGSSTIHCLQFD